MDLSFFICLYLNKNTSNLGLFPQPGFKIPTWFRQSGNITPNSQISILGYPDEPLLTGQKCGINIGGSFSSEDQV